MTVYHSKSLNLDHGDDDCLLCRFVRGDRSPEVLLEVIRILDAQLAEFETESRERYNKLLEKLTA